jgi:formate dehydrogenase iron-sulfur subunit
MSRRPSNANGHDQRTLIDDLLAEQQKLTAVERFSRRHETNSLPAQAKYYRDLIPLTKPQPGQQYAFEVDLDRCSGCKACVTACHSLNGLDDDETWRGVGLLVSDLYAAERAEKEQRRKGAEEIIPFSPPTHFPTAGRSAGLQQHITTACHHCVEPGCLEGCPVLAYDKDPVTGIVRHLDDQCIGCQYCVMKCPYEVPQYSARRGIVRKCDMCANRLAVGEAPACVQACPHEAIKITVVETAAVRENFRGKTGEGIGNRFLPASPAPQITLPTTRYKSAKPLPANLLAGDNARVTPAQAHLPLVFMLVLTQFAVGASVAAVFTEAPRWLALVAAGVSAGGLGIASLHLGKPLKAWRAFLGWRKSWFSREVIVFGGYVPLAMAAAAAFWFAPLAPFQKLLSVTAAATGLLGVVCSAMIYVDTQREFWRASQSFGKFFGTTLLLGAVMALVTTNYARGPLIALLLAATTGKLAIEQRIFRELVDVDTLTLTSLNKTARLLTDELGLAARGRVLCGIFGGIILPLLLMTKEAGAGLAVGAVGLCIVGELLERYLFFTAVAPAKMPGGFAA